MGISLSTHRLNQSELGKYFEWTITPAFDCSCCWARLIGTKCYSEVSWIYDCIWDIYQVHESTIAVGTKLQQLLSNKITRLALRGWFWDGMASASYPDVSGSLSLSLPLSLSRWKFVCKGRREGENGRDLHGLPSLRVPMVPCASSPVTRVLHSPQYETMRKTKRLSRRLEWPGLQGMTHFTNTVAAR